MKRLSKKATALFGGAALLTLAWPGASTADTTLGGYSGTAQAEPVRIQVFEPVIPLPSTPQVDGGIGFTKANTDTGPVSRALASYLWPGDVVGDGFNQLTGDPNSVYPVQVNSRYPATTTAPATNTAQLTEGNGMTTSTDGWSTVATVNGAGISGTNPLSNPLKGLCELVSKQCPKPVALPVPLPSSAPLLGLVQLENVYSQSSVVVGAKTITSTATTHMSKIKLLGGLITIAGVDLTSKTVSDGTKATTTGSSAIGGLTIAGQTVALDGKSITLAGQVIKLPALPLDLSQLGLRLQYAESQRSVAGPTGSLAAQGLIITVDTGAIFNLLGVTSLTNALKALLTQIPGVGNKLGPALSVHPKIVLQLGSVSTSVDAAPAYVLPPIGPTTGTVTPPIDTGSGGLITGGGLPSGNLGGTPTPVTQPPTPTTTPTQPTTQPAAFNLPGLGKVPRWLILGGLFLAGAIGWLFRSAGGFLLSGGRTCTFGLDTGVPDLRKV